MIRWLLQMILDIIPNQYSVCESVWPSLFPSEIIILISQYLVSLKINCSFPLLDSRHYQLFCKFPFTLVRKCITKSMWALFWRVRFLLGTPFSLTYEASCTEDDCRMCVQIFTVNFHRAKFFKSLHYVITVISKESKSWLLSPYRRTASTYFV